MCGADGCDPGRMARHGQPVRNRSTNGAAGNRSSIVAWGLAGNEQQQPGTLGDRFRKSRIEQRMGGGKAVTVKVHDTLRQDGSASKAAIPAGIQPLVRTNGCSSRRRRHVGLGPSRRTGGAARHGLHLRNRRCLPLIERLHGSDNTRPECPFVAPKLTDHCREQPELVRRCPSEAGGAPRLLPTCRRRSALPPRPRPRKCRTGWRP